MIIFPFLSINAFFYCYTIFITKTIYLWHGIDVSELT